MLSSQSRRPATSGGTSSRSTPGRLAMGLTPDRIAMGWNPSGVVTLRHGAECGSGTAGAAEAVEPVAMGTSPLGAQREWRRSRVEAPSLSTNEGGNGNETGPGGDDNVGRVMLVI